jgi:chromosome condensin MukBEF ATPase and DNA-binding subunit MukB
MGFLDELRQRLEKAQKDWERAKQALRDAKAREAQLGSQLSALRSIYDAELEKSGGRKKADVTPLKASPAPSVSQANKAQIVREIIRANPSGLTPAEIRQKAQESGVDFKDAYVYSILLRSKRAGKIEEKNGKYFIVQKTEAAG